MPAPTTANTGFIYVSYSPPGGPGLALPAGCIDPGQPPTAHTPITVTIRYRYAPITGIVGVPVASFVYTTSSTLVTEY